MKIGVIKKEVGVLNWGISLEPAKWRANGWFNPSLHFFFFRPHTLPKEGEIFVKNTHFKGFWFIVDFSLDAVVYTTTFYYFWSNKYYRFPYWVKPKIKFYGC